MTTRILFSIVMIATSLVVSCSSTQDMTDNPSAVTDFVVGKEYSLKQPVFVSAGILKKLGLMGTPKTVEGFKANPPSFVEAVLEPGTTLKIRRVETFRERMSGNVTDVFAEIMSGPNRGKLVNVTWISKQDLKTGYTKRDPATLEPLQGN